MSNNVIIDTALNITGRKVPIPLTALHPAFSCGRTTCKKCGEFRVLTEREIIYSKRNGLSIEKIFGGRGCRECIDTGYKGRVGVYEIMLVTSELQDLIALKTPTQKIREKAVEQGMMTLLQEAVALVREGKTTLEEVESSIG